MLSVYTIVDQLWASGTGECAIGKGKVYAGQTLAQALTALQGLDSDFEYTKPQADTNLLFVHRRLADSPLLPSGLLGPVQIVRLATPPK